MQNRAFLTASFASLASLTGLAASTSAQTSFDYDRAGAPPIAGPGILTEGFPGAPVMALPAFTMGLLPGDEIDALSYGDDHLIGTLHTIVFSVDSAAMGLPGSGVDFEATVDTAPGVAPAAAGDLFIQEATGFFGNFLAPPFYGFAAGTMTGDEANATWGAPCVAGFCYDLDAFDYTAPGALITGVYFSLAPGSPTLGLIGATAGAILYSDMSGAPPVIATLGAGGGPATAGNLGIPGLNLDALNVIGSTGPIGAGGGIITPGLVGPSVFGGIPPASTHLLEFSVSFTGGIDADVLIRVGAGAATTHTPAPALGMHPFENINALEVTEPFDPACPPMPATVSHYNGTGINRDAMTGGKAVIGVGWTATLTPQIGRGPGSWVVMMRTAASADPILDLGPVFALPPAGLSELLVGGGVIGNFFGPPHAGGGTSVSMSLALPFNCSLLGMTWYAQSIVLGDLPAGAGILDPWFSSASTGVVGMF